MSRKTPMHSSFYKGVYNQYRRNTIQELLRCFENCELFYNKLYMDRIKYVELLENEIYESILIKACDQNIIINWYNELFVQMYDIYAYKIISNLSTEFGIDNVKLRNDLLLGKISIVNMTSQEMYPELWHDQQQKIITSLGVSVRRRTTNMYKCSKCKKNECVYEDIITRSLDEGISIKIDCVNCGNTWIIS